MIKKVKKSQKRKSDGFDFVQFKLRIRGYLKEAIAERAAKKKHSANTEAVDLICASLFPSEKPKPLKLSKSVAIQCACGSKFSLERVLLNDAKKGKREIYCPVGHEMSWRGGKLNPREATSKMLQQEFAKHVKFDFTRDLIESIRSVDDD